MNTIINLSNILFSKRKAQDEVASLSAVVSEPFHVEEEQGIEVETKSFVQDETPRHTEIKTVPRTGSFSLSLLCYKVVYEIIICLFYILLSPLYFFEAYTISNNHEKKDTTFETSTDSSSERLFFPKKLIPQSVMTRRKLLVLDLDETLIHSTNTSEESFFSNSNSSLKMQKGASKIESFQIEVSFKLPKHTQIPSIFASSQKFQSSMSKATDITTIYKINQRPYLIQFLKTCNLWYDIVIYTASLREYSEPIINNLEYLSGVFFKEKLYRNDCKVSAGGYVKPLDRILKLTSDPVGVSKNFGKESIIILDNMAISFQEDVSNGIEIESWYGNPEDIELLKLLPLLEGLRNVADVRRILSLNQDAKI